MERFNVGSVDPRIALAIQSALTAAGKGGDLSQARIEQALRNREYVLRERELYYRLAVSGNGDVIQFKTKDKAIEEGVTNLDKGEMPKATYNLITGVKFGIARRSAASFSTTALLANGLYSNYIFDANDLAVDNTDTDSGATGDQFDTYPNQRIENLWINGELEIKLNGSELETISGSKLFTPAVYGQTLGGHADFYDLSQPRFVQGASKLDFNFHRRGNTETIANYTAVEVRLAVLAIEPGAGVQSV